MTFTQKTKYSIKDFFSKSDQIRTIKIPERRHWRRSGIFIVNFEHISHLAMRIWSNLLKKSLIEDFTFCEVDQKLEINTRNLQLRNLLTKTT